MKQINLTSTRTVREYYKVLDDIFLGLFLYLKEIFLDGKIESHHGIKEVKLNEDPFFIRMRYSKDQEEIIVSQDIRL